MKFLILVIIFAFVFIIECKSQSDTLVINLKNGNIEKIAIPNLQKIQFDTIAGSGVEEPNKLNNKLVLKGNYPNPIVEQTSIEFEIAAIGNVILNIYDNSGNQIQKLECNNCQTGKNTLFWNCFDKYNVRVQSGVYYYEVQFGNEVQSKKTIIVK